MKTLFSLVASLFEVVAPSLDEDMSRSNMSWLKTYQIFVNVVKFQFIFFGLKSNETIVLEVGGCSIDVANSVTLLGVAIDSKLMLDQHVSKIF